MKYAEDGSHPQNLVSSVVGCSGLIFIGIQPQDQHSVHVLGGVTITLVIGWFALRDFGFVAYLLLCFIDPSEIERPLMADEFRNARFS